MPFKHARRCATSTWACQSLLQRTQTDVCRTAVFKSRALLSWLPTSFHRIGFAACMSCQQLQIVDLSQTDTLEILGSTFAHCSQLQQLCLPRMLRTIEQEAFYKCISLKEVSTPPFLLYIARHAFVGCTHLRIILKQGKSSTWRGTYAQSNAFDNASTSTSPRGFESCRLMQIIFGEKTF